MTAESTESVKMVPVFLGVANRAQIRGPCHDILGLTNTVALPFFPQTLSGLVLVFALPQFKDGKGQLLRFHLVDQRHTQNTGTVTLQLSVTARAGEAGKEEIARLDVKDMLTLPQDSCIGFQARNPYSVFPMPCPPLFVTEPTYIAITFETNDASVPMGEFTCVFQQPEPLSDEDKDRLTRRPYAFVLNLACKKCGDEIVVYTPPGSQLPPKCRDKPSVVLAEAPEIWRCRCGLSNQPLCYAKLGLHEMVRYRPSGDKCDFTAVYERSALDQLVARYQRLICSAPAESDVQTFLQDHQVFWVFLSPLFIINTPAVLTKKRADFGIVTSDRTLYLVELEKPQTRLFRSDGGQSAEIQRGLDQIDDWRVVVQNDRRTLLSELDLVESRVQEVRFILIAGMRDSQNALGIRKLKQSLAADTSFYTFDDLADRLERLNRSLLRV